MQPPDSSSNETTVETYLRTLFLRRIAHEVRGPAGVITGAIDELQMVLASGADPAALLAMVRRGVARLLRVADVLSMTAELEGPPVEAEFVSVDILPLVRASVDKTVAMLGRRGVDVAVEAAASPVAQIDQRFFGPALVELVANAIRFARTKVLIRVGEDDASVFVLVEDDGPGFPADRTEAHANRFAERNHAGGLGVSLPLVLQVVVAHGGTTTFGASTLPPGRVNTTGLSVRIALPKRH